MLEITRKTLTLEPQEVMELERIFTDEDQQEALIFLKKKIYQRLLTSQENRLKSHLDGCQDPASTFADKK
ncbi:MAG: hypothetical protein OS130_13500 [Thermodesulfobacteriota bacterium]|jgi:hypothetical protein|nr:MAG: hypothetical protein OS130_13500 [Thermodesulfobacteriota bacterium]